MEKNMENEMETGVILVLRTLDYSPDKLTLLRVLEFS